MNKKRLKRIEKKIDVILKEMNIDVDQLNKTIGGGGIKPPKEGGNP